MALHGMLPGPISRCWEILRGNAMYMINITCVDAESAPGFKRLMRCVLMNSLASVISIFMWSLYAIKCKRIQFLSIK